MAGNTSTTRAQENRRIRQDTLRESLSAGSHVQHVIEISDKLADVETKMDAQDASRLKAAADIKLKLINKYLPDLKAVEITRDEEDESPPLNITFKVKEAVSDIKITRGKPKA